MKLIQMFMKLVELHQWFDRKSQFYILGNWTTYIDWMDRPADLFNYFKGYPLAWVKFMWYSRTEILNA